MVLGGEVFRFLPGEPGTWDLTGEDYISTAKPRGYKRLWAHAQPTWSARNDQVSPETLDQLDELTIWYGLAEAFSARALTFEKDRLSAMARLASRMANALGITYAASLRKEDLARGLCCSVRRPLLLAPPDDTAPIPSWSWPWAKDIEYPGFYVTEVSELMLKVS